MLDCNGFDRRGYRSWVGQAVRSLTEVENDAEFVIISKVSLEVLPIPVLESYAFIKSCSSCPLCLKPVKQKLKIMSR